MATIAEILWDMHNSLQCGNVLQPPSYGLRLGKPPRRQDSNGYLTRDKLVRIFDSPVISDRTILEADNFNIRCERR